MASGDGRKSNGWETHTEGGAFGEVEVLQVATLSDAEEGHVGDPLAGAQAQMHQVRTALAQQPRGRLVRDAVGENLG